MKKLYSIALVAFCTLLLPISINAQNISPEDGTIKFDDESRPCLVVHVDPEPIMLKKAWKKYLKDKFELKLSGRDILSAERVTISAISMNAMDFYTQIIEDLNGSEMTVFARHGYDIYVDKENNLEEYNKLRSMMEDFLTRYVTSYHQDIIDDTEKKILKLTKYQEKLQKQIDKDASKASKLKEKAAELEEDVKENTATIEETKEKIKERDEKLKRHQKKLKEVQ